jgi:KipI family sensor histidine kinase inhibitor
MTLSYKIASIDAIVIYMGTVISEEVSDRVLALYHALKKRPLEGIIEIIPSYTTLYLQFDLFLHTHEKLFAQIEAMSMEVDVSSLPLGREMTIPAYFDPSVGLDLERVASLHGLGIDEVIEIYTAKTYRVYTIGFAPGYAYMGSVDERIVTPRLATPRAQIPQGSVAIANTQCAVYPTASPGGWNILGRTATRMFDRSIEGFSYLQAGDSVRFESISREAFIAQGGQL